MKAEWTELASGAVVSSERVAGVESVALGLYFPTGSRDESPATNGISHLIEHLTFKGTPTRSADEVNREIDRLGGGVNAYTSKETLCFHARVLGDDLPRALALLGDIASHALPSGVEPELERERSVILSEIASVEDAPEDLASDLCDRAFFGDHPLGLPVVGCAQAVARLGLPEIRDHLRRHLTGSHLVVAAAGNVDHARLVALAEEHLGDLPPDGSRGPTEAPSPRARSRLVERDLEQVQIFLSASGVARGDPRRPVLEVLSAAVGEGCSSRLFVEVRDRRGLAYTIYSSLASYRDAGSFHVAFGVPREKLEETLDVVRRVLREVRASGITAEELDTAKRQLQTAVRLAHETPQVRMAHLAEQTILGRRETDVGAILERIARVSLDEVRSLAGEVLGAPLAVGAVGPLAEGLVPEGGLEVGA